MESTLIADKALGARNKIRLEWHARQINSAARTIAASLKEIHDQKQWEGCYDSYEHYAFVEWGLNKARAYHILQAQNARLMLEQKGISTEELDSMPDKEVIALAKPKPAKVLKPKSDLSDIVPDSAEALDKEDVPKLEVSAETEPEPKVCPTCRRPL